MRSRRLPGFGMLCLGLSFALPVFGMACGSSAGSAPQKPPGAGHSSSGPNLQVDSAAVPPSIEFTSQDFSAGDCEVQEGCVTGTGTRKLMLFEGDIINAGNADFVLGNPASSPYFKWSACHQHYHLQDIMLYELVRPSTGQVVTSGNVPVVARKQGFCMEDEEPVADNPPPPQFDCTNQGISPGWEDSYQNTLPCQWLDITGVPAGDYFLRITVNPDRIYPETDYDDNVALIPVTISD